MKPTAEPQTYTAERLRFLGARCADSVTLSESVQLVEAAIRSREAHLVVALNVPKLWRMEHDSRLREIVSKAEMIFPERVVVLASRISGLPLRGYVGNDRLTELLLAAAADRGYRVYFLGTRDEILQMITDRVRERWQGVPIVGCRHGFFTPQEDEAVAADIRRARPDILFVGMGTPRQEYWMEKYGRALGVPVVIGVGGTLDVLAGMKTYCPHWLRVLGLEWVYRACEDPRGKLTRYVRALPWFAWTLLTEGILARVTSTRYRP